MLEPVDGVVRGVLTNAIAARGHAPPLAELAVAADLTPEQLEASLSRLQHARALLLHPGTSVPWVVHPFSLTASCCWVETAARGYWASCVYCGFGVVAALGVDATVHARDGAEALPVRYRVQDGNLLDTDGVFHLSIPPSRWWDNVLASCASFQPFASAHDVDEWCGRHDMPRGACLTMPQLWRFARDWYGNALDQPWSPRSEEEKRAVFVRNGLTSAFWTA